MESNLNLPNYYKLYILTLRNIQKLILLSIHIFISVLNYTSNLSKAISINKLKFFINDTGTSKLIENAKKLEKSPKHLLVVIYENEINLNEVADILIWSLFSGIPCITLCDKNGKLIML